MHCGHHLEDTFTRVVAAESVAAVIVEPVLGEGGFVTPPPEFLSTVNEICRRHGIVFIADEVQTGFGRTGKLFACENSGIVPDLLVTAKSLGGGLPLAAVTGRAEMMDHTGPGSLGGTFGGNPLACEAALAMLDIMERDKLPERAMRLGERFRARARAWQERWQLVGEVRGLGAMQAMELVRSRETREPAAEETKEITRYCLERGVIVISAGSYSNVIRLLMPLVITDEQLEEGLDVLESAMETVITRSREREGVVA
jgi:4-aminobutyrate aminotransferase/(S)-3-amino-2-methylpropionate transaminase